MNLTSFSPDPDQSQVYKQQTHLLPVKLTAAELKLLKLEGSDAQYVIRTI